MLAVDLQHNHPVLRAFVLLLRRRGTQGTPSPGNRLQTLCAVKVLPGEWGEQVRRSRRGVPVPGTGPGDGSGSGTGGGSKDQVQGVGPGAGPGWVRGWVLGRVQGSGPGMGPGAGPGMGPGVGARGRSSGGSRIRSRGRVPGQVQRWVQDQVQRAGPGAGPEVGPGSGPEGGSRGWVQGWVLGTGAEAGPRGVHRGSGARAHPFFHPNSLAKASTQRVQGRVRGAAPLVHPTPIVLLETQKFRVGPRKPWTRPWDPQRPSKTTSLPSAAWLCPSHVCNLHNGHVSNVQTQRPLPFPIRDIL